MVSDGKQWQTMLPVVTCNSKLQRSRSQAAEVAILLKKQAAIADANSTNSEIKFN